VFERGRIGPPTPRPSLRRQQAGFEGWLNRLTGAAQYRGPIVGPPRHYPTEGEADDAAFARPTAWQDARNAVIYADNIARALAGADPPRANTPAVPE
jgi:ABC-type Zn uptake system ZnuABC Zn-binding protein ZnuA